jgi:hypothetical protein
MRTLGNSDAASTAAITTAEAHERLRQAARILATGAIRAAQTAKRQQQAGVPSEHCPVLKQ